MDETQKTPPPNRIYAKPYPIRWVELKIYPPGADNIFSFSGEYISEIRTQRADRMFNGNVRIKIGYKTKYKVKEKDQNEPVYKFPNEIFLLRSIVEIYVGNAKTKNSSYYLIQTAYIYSVGFEVNYNGEAELQVVFKPLDSILSDHKIFVTTYNVADMITGTFTTKGSGFQEYDPIVSKTNNKVTFYMHGNGTNIKNFISNLKKNTMVIKQEKELKAVTFGGSRSLVEFPNEPLLTELLLPVVFDATKSQILNTSLKEIGYVEEMIKTTVSPRSELGSDYNYKTAFSKIPVPFITNVYYEPLIKYTIDNNDYFNSVVISSGTNLNECSKSVISNSIIVSATPYNFWFIREKDYYRWRTMDEMDKLKIPYYYIEDTSQYNIEFSSDDVFTLMTQATNTTSGGIYPNSQDTSQIFGNKSFVYETSIEAFKDVYKAIFSILFPTLFDFEQTKIGKGTIMIPYCPVRVNYPIFFKGIDGQILVGRVSAVVDDINAEGNATTSIDIDLVPMDNIFEYSYSEVESAPVVQPTTEPSVTTTPAPTKNKKKKVYKLAQNKYKSQSSKTPAISYKKITATVQIPDVTGDVEKRPIPNEQLLY